MSQLEKIMPLEEFIKFSVESLKAHEEELAMMYGEIRHEMPLAPYFAAISTYFRWSPEIAMGMICALSFVERALQQRELEKSL